jgi:hypothetical protein
MIGQFREQRASGHNKIARIRDTIGRDCRSRLRTTLTPATFHARRLSAYAPTNLDENQFAAPWRPEKIPGAYVVRDANGQALAYVYSRPTESAAMQAKVPTEDEARRVAANIARMPNLLARKE